MCAIHKANRCSYFSYYCESSKCNLVKQMKSDELIGKNRSFKISTHQSVWDVNHFILSKASIGSLYFTQYISLLDRESWVIHKCRRRMPFDPLLPGSGTSVVQNNLCETTGRIPFCTSFVMKHLGKLVCIVWCCWILSVLLQLFIKQQPRYNGCHQICGWHMLFE